MKQKRSVESVVTEWVLKLALIFYIFSFIFGDLGMANETEMSFAGIDVISWIIVFAFGIFLFMIEKGVFKIVFFSVSIIAALFKSLLFLSKDIVFLNDFMNLSDEILIIAASFYYMSRYFKQQKRKSSNEKTPFFKTLFAKSEDEFKPKHHTHRSFNKQMNEVDDLSKE